MFKRMVNFFKGLRRREIHIVIGYSVESFIVGILLIFFIIWMIIR